MAYGLKMVAEVGWNASHKERGIGQVWMFGAIRVANMIVQSKVGLALRPSSSSCLKLTITSCLP